MDGDVYGVEQGQIIVNNLDVVIDTGDVLVVEADCHTKYGGMIAYSGSSVLLWAGEHTIKDDRDTGMPTKIILPARCADWSLQAEYARYTVRITAYRYYGTERREVWARADTS